MAESLLILITKGPYGLEEAFAGARLALGCKVSGIMENAAILLIGDGTLNACKGQRSEAVGMPSNLAALQDFMDLEGVIYCLEQDLRHRVGETEVLEGVNMITWDQAREIIKSYQLVNTF